MSQERPPARDERHHGEKPGAVTPNRALWYAIASLAVPPLGGIAVVAGVRAWRQGGGRKRDARAVVAAVLGCISMCTTMGAIVAWRAVSSEVEGRWRAPTAAAEPVVLALPVPRGTAGEGARHHESTLRIGNVDVVEIGPTVRSLRGALARQCSEAHRSGRSVLLMITVADCAPCRGVFESMKDERVERAVAPTRVVSVSADHFAFELARLGVPVDAFPGFVLLDSEGRAVDYIHGGEWDEDVPANVAPVLESFVRGAYVNRRDRWRPEHADETHI